MMTQLQNCLIAMKREDVGNGAEINKNFQQARILSIKLLMESGVIQLHKTPVKKQKIVKLTQNVLITVQQDGDNDSNLFILNFFFFISLNQKN